MRVFATFLILYLFASYTSILLICCIIDFKDDLWFITGIFYFYILFRNFIGMCWGLRLKMPCHIQENYPSTRLNISNFGSKINFPFGFWSLFYTFLQLSKGLLPFPAPNCDMDVMRLWVKNLFRMHVDVSWNILCRLPTFGLILFFSIEFGSKCAHPKLNCFPWTLWNLLVASENWESLPLNEFIIKLLLYVEYVTGSILLIYVLFWCIT